MGQHGKKKFDKGGSDLATAPSTYDPFFPQSPDQWKHVSFSLSYFEGDLLIRFRDISGWGNHLYIDNVRVDLLTSTKENSPIAVSNVFPNPFINSCTFEYNLSEPSQVKLSIYDSFGRLVAEPVNEFRQSGKQQETWNAGNLPSGIYFSRMSAGKQVLTQKIIKSN